MNFAAVKTITNWSRIVPVPKFIKLCHQYLFAETNHFKECTQRTIFIKARNLLLVLGQVVKVKLMCSAASRLYRQQKCCIVPCIFQGKWVFGIFDSFLCDINADISPINDKWLHFLILIHCDWNVGKQRRLAVINNFSSSKTETMFITNEFRSLSDKYYLSLDLRYAIVKSS